MNIKPTKKPVLQDYKAGSGGILGVAIVAPPKHRDDGGTFMELGRSSIEYPGIESFVNFKFGLSPSTPPVDFQHLQTNYSTINPGVIKAFHLHAYQEDIWFVMDDAIVVLWDCREDSSTYGEVIKCTPTEKLIYIPRGVAHGISNPYNHTVHMNYFVNQYWNQNDEFRLDWDSLGPEIWEIAKG